MNVFCVFKDIIIYLIFLNKGCDIVCFKFFKFLLSGWLSNWYSLEMFGLMIVGLYGFFKIVCKVVFE